MEMPDWLTLFSIDINVDSEVPTGTQYIYAVLPHFEAMMLKPQSFKAHKNTLKSA